jgi:hypothetical protein
MSDHLSQPVSIQDQQGGTVFLDVSIAWPGDAGAATTLEKQTNVLSPGS